MSLRCFRRCSSAGVRANEREEVGEVSLMRGETNVGYRCAGRNFSSRSIDMRLPSLTLPFTVFALITRENSEAEIREESEGNSMGLILDARSSPQ